MARRRLCRPKKAKVCAVFSVFLGFIPALFLIYTFNARMRPILTSLAFAEIRNDVVLLMGQAADSLSVSYDDVIHIETNANGEIIALQNNMSAVSIYRTRILNYLAEHSGKLHQKTIRIPTGALTGIDLLSGIGPEIPVRFLSVNTPASSFENFFSSAGINQTRHRVMLKITVTVELLLAGVVEREEISTEVCIAETIIVGAVPERYTYFSN